MKRKSIVSFVLGLLGGILTLGFSLFYITITVFGDTLITAIENAGGSSSIEMGVYVAMSWIAFFGAIIGIVGSCFCFNKARAGGILLGISTIGVTVYPAYLLLQAGIADVFSTSLGASIYVLWFLPNLMMLTATVFALIAKQSAPQQKVYYVGNQPYVQAPVQQAPEIKKVESPKQQVAAKLVTTAKSAVQKPETKVVSAKTSPAKTVKAPAKTTVKKPASVSSAKTPVAKKPATVAKKPITVAKKK